MLLSFAVLGLVSLARTQFSNSLSLLHIISDDCDEKESSFHKIFK